MHDAFVVRYEEGKQRHLPLHRDQSTHSFTASNSFGAVTVVGVGVGCDVNGGGGGGGVIGVGPSISHSTTLHND